jgi:hypothetical protein
MARSFRGELPVILLSGRESDSPRYPLIRKPILRSDLQLVVAETRGPAKGRECVAAEKRRYNGRLADQT